MSDAFSDGILKNFLGRSWGVMLLRGLAAILFGLVSVAWPQISLISLILVYAVYALADGALSLAAALRAGMRPHWWLMLVGLVSLGAGVVAGLWPIPTAVVLAITIGVWAVIRGVLEIAGAIALRRIIHNEWWLALSGVASILFGATMIVAPGPGALALVWLIGVYAVAVGVFLVMLSFRLRRLQAPQASPLTG